MKVLPSGQILPDRIPAISVIKRKKDVGLKDKKNIFT
jgi:hypothetical protein